MKLVNIFHNMDANIEFDLVNHDMVVLCCTIRLIPKSCGSDILPNTIKKNLIFFKKKTVVGVRRIFVADVCSSGRCEAPHMDGRRFFS